MRKRKLISRVERSVAFISDLHVGSRFAICPDKYQTAEKQWIIPSAGQAYLNNSLAAFGKVCDSLGVDTVLVNGDALHGQNVAENGIGLSTTNLDEQIAMCVETIRPLVKKRKLLMISGTGYHKTARGINPEKSVCDALGGIWLGPLANLSFKPSKKVFNIHHGYSGSVIYREMILAREGLFAKWAEANGTPHVDVIIRGHLHSFIHIHEHGLHMIQLPCWTAMEPSKITLKLYFKMLPDIGGVVINMDNEDRLTVFHYLYPVPTIAGEIRSE